MRGWRSGVDFWADLVQAGGARVGVLRSPRTQLLETSYDGLVDFGAVLEREAVALSLTAQAGIPVLSVLARSPAPGPDVPSWTLLTFVPHDDHADLPLGEWQSQARSLLHMDLRAGNICVRDGAVEGIIDLANCIVGDPLMELGRIRGFGLLDKDFLAGYGLSVEPLAPDQQALPSSATIRASSTRLPQPGPSVAASGQAQLDHSMVCRGGRPCRSAGSGLAGRSHPRARGALRQGRLRMQRRAPRRRPARRPGR